MPYAHFLVPCEGGEAEDRLNHFLAAHAILKLEQELVRLEGEAFWAYAIRYDEHEGATRRTPGAKTATDRIDYREKLGERDFSLYLKLRDWRKERADKAGTVPFALFTNAHLADIAKKRPATLAALGEIDGVGPGRLQSYGAEVLKLVEEHGAGEPKDETAG